MDIKGKELFLLLLRGFSGISLAFSLLAGTLSLFGLVPINFNGSPITGVSGLVIALVFAPVSIIAFSVNTWLALSAGLWISSRIEKMVHRVHGSA